MLLSPKNFEAFFQAKYIDPSSLQEKINMLKGLGQTLVTLNGSFDLLHAGHLHTIYEASQQGDILLVALNTDASIQAYKSPLRPIIPLKHRLEMMASIAWVDYVTSFSETDPRTLLEIVRPDVHVNGPEYVTSIETPIVEKHGGRVHRTSFIPGLSTSNIVTKIQHTCASKASQPSSSPPSAV